MQEGEKHQVMQRLLDCVTSFEFIWKIMGIQWRALSRNNMIKFSTWKKHVCLMDNRLEGCQRISKVTGWEVMVVVEVKLGVVGWDRGLWRRERRRRLRSYFGKRNNRTCLQMGERKPSGEEENKQEWPWFLTWLALKTVVMFLRQGRLSKKKGESLFLLEHVKFEIPVIHASRDVTISWMSESGAQEGSFGWRYN